MREPILHHGTVRRVTVRAAAGLLLASTLAGCASDAGVTAGTPPGTRTLALTLATPHGDDGAALLTVTGPALLAVRAAPGLEVTELRDTVGTSVRSVLLVRGALAGGVVAHLDVPRGASTAGYTVRLEQVAAGAAGGYARRADLAAYRVSVR